MARFEYIHAFDGSYRQGLAYADMVGSTGYVLTGMPTARDAITGGLTLQVETGHSLTLDLEYLVTGGLDHQLFTQRARAGLKHAF